MIAVCQLHHHIASQGVCGHVFFNKAGPLVGHIRGRVLCFCVFCPAASLNHTKPPNKPLQTGRTQIASPSPVPESETSGRSVCVFAAPLIMQTQLSPIQVKEAFVEVRVLVCMCGSLGRKEA